MNDWIINKHWTQGGTGATNFDVSMLPYYEEAVKIYNSPDVAIHPTQFDEQAKLDWDARSLHSKRDSNGRFDLTEFWRVFDGVLKKHGITYNVCWTTRDGRVLS